MCRSCHRFDQGVPLRSVDGRRDPTRDILRACNARVLRDLHCPVSVLAVTGCYKKKVCGQIQCRIPSPPSLEAPWPDLLQPASTGQSMAVPRGPFPMSTLVQQFCAGRRIPKSPLEAPWTGLRRPGERSMEGPFSPSATGRRVGTARSERPRPWLARRAPPWGCPFFGTFLWASKERYSPARDAGRSKYAACGGRNSVQACPLAKDQVVQAPVKAAFNNPWSPFSPAMRL